MPPNPPLPLYAEFIPLGASYRIIFDQDLLPGATVPGNYDITYNLLDRIPTNAAIVANRVHILAADDVTFAPPNGISYHAAPPELFGLTGIPVPPFFKIPFI